MGEEGGPRADAEWRGGAGGSGRPEVPLGVRSCRPGAALGPRLELVEAPGTHAASFGVSTANPSVSPQGTRFLLPQVLHLQHRQPGAAAPTSGCGRRPPRAARAEHLQGNGDSAQLRAPRLRAAKGRRPHLLTRGAAAFHNSPVAICAPHVTPFAHTRPLRHWASPAQGRPGAHTIRAAPVGEALGLLPDCGPVGQAVPRRD